MSASDEFFSASEAARRIGVSAKALRLYEARGLIRPLRSAAGWRTYGPTQMEAAAEVAALRALGLSLRQVAAVLAGDAARLDAALVQHRDLLEVRLREIGGALERVRALRARLADGRAPEPGELSELVRGAAAGSVAFELPWPWGGERFELPSLAAITYIVGPLGSGKTRLAEALAAAVPGGVFVGLERAAYGDGEPGGRIAEALDWLVEDGATRSDALLTLLGALEHEGPAAVVIDMVEQGLDQATQEALAGWLRHRRVDRRPLFLMTRSTSILDLDAVGPDEAIIFCPANHSPPFLVPPYPGSLGYEAMATCLGTPEVRARMAGTIAWRPKVA